MSNCQEHVKRQIAIIKAVNSFGNGLSQDWKIEVYKQVNKWLLSDRITEERRNNTHRYTAPQTQKYTQREEK